MTECVAIVGSREGADEEAVRRFVRALHAKHPDTILLSGGAPGVDTVAEQEWLSLGGRLKSYRPTKVRDEHYEVEVWELGGETPMVYRLQDFPSFENYKSAALARDTLIADEADRLVGFTRRGGSRGTAFTMAWGEESQPKPRYHIPCE